MTTVSKTAAPRTAAGKTPATSMGRSPAHAAMLATSGAADPRRWWALVFIALAQLMVVLDMTIVNIALPHTQADLHITDANRQWVITAYTLAFGGLLLLGGRISDLIGRKRTFLIGLIGFGLSSALGGAAVNAGMLFGARALQGAFAAVLAPAALSLLTTTFSNPRERGKAFGIYGAIAGGGSAIGLIAGGVLTEYLSWRWCMYVNVPIAVIAVFGAIFLLKDQVSEHTDRRLDIPGVIFGSAGLLAIVYGFTEAESRGWHDSWVLALLIGGVVLLAAFTVVQAKVARPLLPLHIVRDRNRAGAFLSVALTTVGMFGLFLFLTYFLQVNLGYSPVKTGMAFLPMTAAIIIGSTQVGARLLPHVPPRWLMVPGALLGAIGMGLLTQLDVDSSYTTLVLPAELLLGFGMGLVMMPAMSTATSGVAPRDAGVTSATVTTAQQVGGSVGTALLNTIAASTAATYITAHGHNPLDIAKGTVHGYSVAVFFGTGVLVLAAIVAGLLINTRPPKPVAKRVETSPAQEAAAIELAGWVRTAGGGGVANAALTLIDDSGRQAAQAVASADGRYRLAVSAAGDYLLITSAVAHQPEAATVTVGDLPTTFDVVLAGAARLSGKVSETSGDAVAGAIAVLTDQRGEVVGSVATSTDGSYSFDALPPAEYTLAVSHPDRQPLAATVAVRDGDPTVHDIAMPASARISGTVRDPGGRGVPRALVTLMNAEGTVAARTATDPDGGYGFGSVRAGKYTVITSGYSPSARSLVVSTPDHRHDVELSH